MLMKMPPSLYPLSFSLYPSLVVVHGSEIAGRHIGSGLELPVKIGDIIKTRFHANLGYRNPVFNQQFFCVANP